jgi:hypothetical protein
MRPLFDDLVFNKAWGYRVARHALFWLSYFGVFQIMDITDGGLLATKVALSYLLLNMLFVYLALYFLVPRLLMRSAYWSFFCWYCVAGLACLTLDYFWGHLVVYRIWLVNYHIPKRDFWHTIMYILDPTNFTVANIMAGLGVGIKMYKFWRGEVWQKLQISQEKTKAELELLKARLHPYFLVNTLNKLYAMVIDQSEEAPRMLMRLSAILSYSLYECRSADVPLEREISICQDYIELERQRFGDRLDVSEDFSGPIEGKRIAPMLFQPFIENAFHWGTTNPGQKMWMSIEMSVQGNQLFFRVINSVDSDDSERQSNSGNAGIDNNIRRLALLYPGRHWLNQEKGDGVYIVSLTIDLTPAPTAGSGSADSKKEPLLYENAVFNY